MIQKFDLHLLQFWGTQNTFRPVRLRLPHSGVEGNQKHFWAGRAVYISLRRRRVTQNTFGPARLRLPHSGVDGHQDHIWTGRAVFVEGHQ
jgi:hypothetical protein